MSIPLKFTSPSVPASGTTWAQLVAGGLKAHIANMLVALATPLANPTTALTVSVNGGGTIGGALAPGVYLANYTNFDGLGETLPATESASFTIAQQVAPATPTVSATGGGASGGLLEAGTAYIKVTYSDGTGETTAAESAVFTVGATNIPRVTFGAVPTGMTGNIYITAAGGALGSEVLYHAGIAAAATTYDLAVARPVSVQVPPTVNGTSTNIPTITVPALPTGVVSRRIYLTQPAGLTGTETLYGDDVTATTYNLATLASATTAPLPTVNTTAPTAGQAERPYLDVIQQQGAWVRANTLFSNFLSGHPVDITELMGHLESIAFSYKAVWTAIEEASVLVAANQGHLTTSAGNVYATTQRVWP